MDSQPKLKYDIGSRDNAHGRLETLSPDKHYRAVLFAIFEKLWPIGQEHCADSLVIPVPELIIGSGLSNGTVLTKIKCMANSGFVKKVREGKLLRLSINWTRVFATKGEIESVQKSTPDKLDRSKSGGQDAEPENCIDTNLDRSPGEDLYRSNFGPDDLDRSNLSQSTQPKDCFTPLERIANALEDGVKLQRDLVALAIENRDLLRKLVNVRPDPASDLTSIDANLDRSKSQDCIDPNLNRSSALNSNSIQRMKSLNSIEIKEQTESIQNWIDPKLNRSQADTLDRSKIGRVPVDLSKWPYPYQKFTPQNLADDQFLYTMWQDAVKSGWPGTEAGLLDFVSLAEFALKLSGGQGGAFLNGVRAKKWGATGTDDEVSIKRAKLRLPNMRSGQALQATPPPARASPSAKDELTIERCLQVLDGDFFAKQRFIEIEKTGKDPRLDPHVQADLARAMKRATPTPLESATRDRQRYAGVPSTPDPMRVGQLVGAMQ